MNRRRRQPMRMRVTAQPRVMGGQLSPGKPWAKIVVLSVLVAFCLAGALGFAAFQLLSSKSTRSKQASPTQIVSATATPSPAPIAKQSTTPVNTSSGSPGTIVALSPSPTPTTTGVLVPEPTTLANQSGHETKSPSELDRKTAEQGRREAERKRARLEAMYQKHQISDEAYKKGQDEYKTEIAKYRNVLTGGGSGND